MKQAKGRVVALVGILLLMVTLSRNSNCPLMPAGPGTSDARPRETASNQRVQQSCRLRLTNP